MASGAARGVDVHVEQSEAAEGHRAPTQSTGLWHFGPAAAFAADWPPAAAYAGGEGCSACAAFATVALGRERGKAASGSAHVGSKSSSSSAGAALGRKRGRLGGSASVPPAGPPISNSRFAAVEAASGAKERDAGQATSSKDREKSTSGAAARAAAAAAGNIEGGCMGSGRRRASLRRGLSWDAAPPLRCQGAQVPSDLAGWAPTTA